MTTPYLISGDVEELGNSQDTSSVRLGKYRVQLCTVFLHLVSVPSNQSIQQEEDEE